ncbi:MAG: AAA family ATPase [Fibrobacteres bacterium]|nr:AAA family ATPase [Fibrobacterota bacterium]
MSPRGAGRHINKPDPDREEDIFTAEGEAAAGTPAEVQRRKDSPLAARMRPRTLDEFIGQEHILGPGRLLRRAIQADQLSSIILYGPPGTGKTTLARIIANTTKAHFIAINAVLAGVKDIREAIEAAKETRALSGRKTILFVDEVHRFNKAQQDALLPHVENGTLTLIGATTENPYFEVNKALVSRSRIFQLRPLGEADVSAVIRAALADPERGFGKRRVEIDPEALAHLVRVASGDARSALNALELAVETTPAGDGGIIQVTLSVAEESIQRRAVLYDKDGDTHYDTISAFIKSVRGSDADASLYWLAKMVYAGEDPRFLFRRMLILASEDVGLADPNALAVVSAAAQAFDYVGLPEGQFHLAQACLYLASAPKSNTTMAYYDALESVRQEQEDEVPDHLKDASRDGADFGHGQGYQYPHAFRDHWVAQQYLPSSLQGKVFYQPSDSGYEAAIRDRVARNREAQMEAAERERQESAPPKAGSGSAASSMTARSRSPKAGSWLDRAAAQTGETLKKVRDEIFRLAAVKRDSLVLDLGGGTGFLTWEACRRAPAGGVWSRCEDAAQRSTMEEWARHLEVLARPELVTASLSDLPKALAAVAEPPRFDAWVGLEILRLLPDPQAWLAAMSPFAAPGARLVWAEPNPGRSQSLGAYLPPARVGPSLSAKLVEIETAWRARLPSSPLEAVKSAWAGPANASLAQRDISALRHFTPSQIRTWFPEAGRRPESLLAAFAQALTPSEKSQIEGALADVFQGSGAEWRQGYDFLIIVFPERP